MFGLAAGGLDPSGGAGLIVDILTFSAFGLRPQAVVTASTVQSVETVERFRPSDRVLLHDQLRLIFETQPPAVVKIGMLGNDGPAHALADALSGVSVPIVLDPVLASSSGSDLLSPEGFGAMVERLFPLARVVTPNVMEAKRLAGFPLDSKARTEDLAEKIFAKGPKAVIVKGGHLEGEPADHVFDGSAHRDLRGVRVPNVNVRGTGCMFASALAAGLAHGMDLFSAAREAKRFVATVLTAADGRAGNMQIGAIPRIWEIRDV